MIELSEAAEYYKSNCERPYRRDRQLKDRLEVALQGHEQRLMERSSSEKW